MSTLPAAVPARGAVVARSVLLRGSWSAVALCFGTATAAVTATIGPDARWLGALGRVVAERGHIPDGVPVVAALLRREAAAPSRRIWLLPPLLALWSNLHGVALLGLAAAGAYLVLERARRRPLESLLVAALSAAALCATPALAATPRYYHDVLTSVAARRGYGLWAPLSLHSGFDLLLVGVGAVLLAAFLRSRPRPWEIAVAALLVWSTVHTARNGVWLLLYVAAPAAARLRLRGTPHPAVANALALLCVFVGALGIARGPQS